MCLLQDFMSTSCTGQVFKAWVNELPFSPLTSDHFQLLLAVLEGYRPQVTSVVTSRPWAVQQLLENVGIQHLCLVDILGFTKKDIFKYLSQSFSEEGHIQ